ncbi:tetratricopeptide repeat protein [Limnohabitans radicicola]|uniref:Tetratricopeptide repeat protein n=1 Tax=Limnohabitans radicicola TaxID=2771427 RepID=A0A927IKJ6_9BURK|nr:tetratricopeptide repeat protein [Limnohabitans radicicola]MBD8049703.1 tetratricopeptide repeat protein [Limnohabitans radicicola]
MASSVLQHTLYLAEHHWRSRRLTAAAKLYQQVLRSLPMHALAHSRLASLQLQAGHPHLAVPHLEKVLQGQPALPQHWVRLVRALQQAGDLERARACLDQSQQFGLPEHAIAQLAHSLSQPPDERQHALLATYQKGHHLTTEIAARLFMDDFPDHPLGWQVLGAVLHDAGRLEDALAVKLQTVEQLPQDANAHNNLACTQLALKDYAGALKSAQAALAIDPAHASAKLHEAQALKGMKA